MLTVMWLLVMLANDGQPNGKEIRGLLTQEVCQALGNALVHRGPAKDYRCESYKITVMAPPKRQGGPSAKLILIKERPSWQLFVTDPSPLGNAQWGGRNAADRI
jgi:hypothetical protein